MIALDKIDFKSLKKSFEYARFTYLSLFDLLKSIGAIEGDLVLPEIEIKILIKSHLIVLWTKEEFNVDLKSDKQSEEVLRGRYAVIHLLSKYTLLSDKMIAAEVARDRTSILYAKKTVVGWMDTNSEYKQKIDRIEKRIIAYIKHT